MRVTTDTVSLQLTRQELAQIKILLQVRKKRLQRKIRLSTFVPSHGQQNADVVLLKTIVKVIDKVYEVEDPIRYG